MGSIPITRFCYVLNQEPGRQSGDRAPDLYSVIYVYKALKTRSKMSKSVNWQNDLFAEDCEWLYSVYKLLVIFDWYVKMPAQIIRVNISFTPCVLLPDMLYLRHKEGNRKRLPAIV